MLRILALFALIFFSVGTAVAAPKKPVREYWIAVESEHWNLAPHADPMTGKSFKPEDTTFAALRYHAYTQNFASRAPESEWAGIAGPVIEADVGDHVIVHFKNLDSTYKRPHSIHVHGFDYDPAMDGGYSGENPNKPGTAVAFGESFTYEYDASNDSTGIWPYHDHSVDALDNMDRGMFGAIRIYGSGETKADREFYVFLTGFEKNITGLKEDFDTINGYAYAANTPHFMAHLGERVRFNVIAFGTEFHTFHIHGYRWNEDGHMRDVKVVGPGSAWSVEFPANKAGDWMYHCHVEDHMAHGMMGMFMVM